MRDLLSDKNETCLGKRISNRKKKVAEKNATTRVEKRRRKLTEKLRRKKLKGKKEFIVEIYFRLEYLRS